MKNIGYWIIITLLVCCEQVNRNVQTKKNIDKGNMIIEVMDTIQCNFVDNVTFLGSSVYKDSLMVIFNPIENGIRVVDFTGKIVAHLNKSGYDNEGFGQFIGGVSFLDDGSLIVLSELGFYNYTQSGELISHFKHTDKIEMNGGGLYSSGQMNLQLIRNSNKNVTGFIAMINLIPNDEVTQESFYTEARLLNKIDYPSFDYRSILKYPENSIYLQANGYFNNQHPLYTLSSNGKLNVIYNLEGLIYQYNLETMELMNQVSIEPADFTICEPFDFGTTSNDYVVTLKSDYYTNILSSGDTLFITYTKWLDENDEIQSVSDFNSKGYLFSKHYLQVLIPITNELYEIELPEGYPYLKAISNGNLLLQQEVRFLEVEPDNENILVAKLKFSDS